MPQAIDLVVNNGDATPISKTFTLISPAAGMGGVAEWALQEGPISSVFPTFTASASVSRQSGIRTLVTKLRVPSSYTDAVTGLTNVGSYAEFSVTEKLPPDFPENLKANLVAYALNLLNTDLIKVMVRNATPAT